MIGVEVGKVGRIIDFPSVRPRPSVTRYNSHMRLATLTEPRGLSSDMKQIDSCTTQ